MDMNYRKIRNRQVAGLMIIIITFITLICYCATCECMEFKTRITGVVLSVAMIIMLSNHYHKHIR